MGERTLTLPLIASKLLKKRVIYISSGSLIKPSESHKGIFSGITGILKRMNLVLSDIIILYSDRLIDRNDYAKFKDKIVFAHEHFKNTDRF